ncbi:MAG: hypothetical protein NZO16_01420 [Deltaproteobacteria bacterium]|nr:hypothetical protein [Deltaproteobacteria bacterium]
MKEKVEELLDQSKNVESKLEIANELFRIDMNVGILALSHVLNSTGLKELGSHILKLCSKDFVESLPSLQKLFRELGIDSIDQKPENTSTKEFSVDLD